MAEKVIVPRECPKEPPSHPSHCNLQSLGEDNNSDALSKGFQCVLPSIEISLQCFKPRSPEGGHSSSRTLLMDVCHSKTE